ncbi:hypothetical protein F1C58_15840 [Glaciihabitans sp. INWT7]|uniref:hypothetical protein n=1 Tax=Glaciihabitans sp. INWT7 TaxID=2596912 RepID=UPI0016264488|nr:hypothetical protein [Glaciihabitans sp. INWT7]QNE48224.1 hypothetical protein F1C58_15840 [Glaciihabitans sp. INWT7]
MSVITRSWLSFAAIGAGVIHLALVISSPLAVGIPLAMFGLAELTWGVLILVKDRLLVPRLAQAGALAPVLLWSLLTVTATLLAAPQIAASLRFVPMGIAALFELFIAAILSVILRRRSTATATATAAAREPKAPGAVRYLAAVMLAGILVGGLTTPVLAATQAGTVAMQHGGTMGGMMDMNMPGMGH